jgi:hypothetical protein
MHFVYEERQDGNYIFSLLQCIFLLLCMKGGLYYHVLSCLLSKADTNPQQ